jgi:hypothetical protein
MNDQPTAKEKLAELENSPDFQRGLRAVNQELIEAIERRQRSSHQVNHRPGTQLVTLSEFACRDTIEMLTRGTPTVRLSELRHCIYLLMRDYEKVAPWERYPERE